MGFNKEGNSLFMEEEIEREIQNLVIGMNEALWKTIRLKQDEMENVMVNKSDDFHGNKEG